MSASLDQKFTADASQIEAVYEKMKRHNQDLLTQLQKLKQEQKQGHEQSNRGEQERSHWLKTSFTDVTKLAAGYFGVQTAIQFISEAWQHAAQQMEKANKQAEEINDKVIAAGVATKELHNADKIKAFAQAAAASGQVTQEDAVTIYREASQAHPGASFERKRDIATSLLRQRPILNDDELADYAKVAGKNAKLFGDKIAPGEIADLTLAMREMAGMRFNELKDRDFDKGAYKLGASGAMSKEEGLAFAVSAVVNNQEAGIIERFANKIFDQMDTKQVTPGMTAAQRREIRYENKYAKMSPAQRYEALRTDDAMAQAVLDSDYLNFKQLQQDVPRITKHLQEAIAPGDYTASRLKEVGTQAVVQERTQRNRIEALKSEALSENEIRAGAIKRSTEFVNAAIERNNPVGPNWMYTYSETGNTARSIGKSVEDIPAHLVKSGVGTGTGLTEADVKAFVEKERELITRQLEAAKAMKEAAEEMKRNRAVPAQPINVRARGESR